MAIRLLDVLKSQICRSQSAECSQQSKDKAFALDRGGKGIDSNMLDYCFISHVNLPPGCNQCRAQIRDPIVWESINSFRAYLDTTNEAAT